MTHPSWCAPALCTVEVAGRGGEHEYSRAEHRGHHIDIEHDRARALVCLRQEPGQPPTVGMTVAWGTIGATGHLSGQAAAQLGQALSQLATEALT
jgi:hypothetical protein